MSDYTKGCRDAIDQMMLELINEENIMLIKNPIPDDKVITKMIIELDKKTGDIKLRYEIKDLVEVIMDKLMEE